MRTITRDMAARQIDKHARLAERAEAVGWTIIARRHRRWVECWRDALALLA